MRSIDLSIDLVIDCTIQENRNIVDRGCRNKLTLLYETSRGLYVPNVYCVLSIIKQILISDVKQLTHFNNDWPRFF